MRKTVLAAMAALLVFAGCHTSDHISEESSTSPKRTDEELAALFEQYDCGDETWQAPEFPSDHAPIAPEESGLYQKLPVNESIPYEEIEVRAFGNGKVVYSYMTEKFGQNGGGEDYDAGQAVIYDIKTGQYVAGDTFPRESMWSGERVFAGDGCYYVNMNPEDIRFTALTKLDLTTGKISAAAQYSESVWLGYLAKLDDSRFTVEVPQSESVDLFDASDNSITKLLTVPVLGTNGIYCWNGDVLHMYNEIRDVILEKERFVDGPLAGKESVPHVSRIDPDTGNEKVYEVVQTITVHPGTDITELLEGQEYSFHSDLHPFWLVYGEDTIRGFELSEQFGGDENETGMAQNTGIYYHWDTAVNVLYSMDIQTGKLQYLDFGHREKWMWFFHDENGNVLLSVEDKRGAGSNLIGVYYIPADTIREQSTDYLPGN